LIAGQIVGDGVASYFGLACVTDRAEAFLSVEPIGGEFGVGDGLFGLWRRGLDGG